MLFIVMEVIGFPNYLINEYGRIYSKISNMYLKSKYYKGSYKTISLYHEGKPYNLQIHKLIALHYIPNPYNRIIKQLTKSKYNLVSEDFRIIDNSVEIRTHIYTFTHL